MSLLPVRKAFRKFETARIRAKQYWVISYPKSGRTWLRVMLDDLQVAPLYSHAGSDAWDGEEAMRSTITGFERRRVVFMYRNPLDTLVSRYFYETKHHKRFEGTIGEFLRVPNRGIGHILLFNKLWLASGRRFRDFCEVNYDTMRADPTPDIRRIVDFMHAGLISDKAISQVVEANSFSRMKERETSGEMAKRFPAQFRQGDTEASALKVRSGKVGGYREHLTDEDIAFCMAEAQRIGVPLELPHLALEAVG